MPLSAIRPRLVRSMPQRVSRSSLLVMAGQRIEARASIPEAAKEGSRLPSDQATPHHTKVSFGLYSEKDQSSGGRIACRSHGLWGMVTPTIVNRLPQLTRFHRHLSRATVRRVAKSCHMRNNACMAISPKASRSIAGIMTLDHG